MSASKLMRMLTLGVTSVLGVGYMPLAPGTFGTLAALPLWWLASSLSLPAYLAALLAVIALAVLASSQAERIYGSHDQQHIVIDEVAGLLTTVVGIPFGFEQALAAFVVFRVLDIWKPPPVRQIDERVSGGWGVVLDDVAAGVIGCGVLHAFAHLRGWP